MSSPAIAPVVPDNVKAARQQVQTSNFFGLCYLMLCQLAYTAENSAQKAVQQIIQLLPTMPAPQAYAGGKWNLGWGPVASSDNGNLMYAAEFSISGFPVFSAVAIRGTDTEASPAGLLKQIIEDLDAEHQVVFPENNTVGSKIAHGTKVGLDVLTGFKDKTGRTVDQYLNDFVHNNPRTPVVVTGHSLGGCQTTVLALHLSGKLPAGTVVVPNSFAAPTAGNPAFINLYERTFHLCPRWFNPIDLVPMAFADLGGIKKLWSQCNRPAPDVIRIVIDAMEILLKLNHSKYSQQSAGDSISISAACQPSTAKATGLAALAVAEVQKVLEDAVGKLEAEVKKLPVIGGLAAHALSFELKANSFENLDGWVRELLFQHLILTGYWDGVEKVKGVASIPNPFQQAAGATA